MNEGKIPVLIVGSDETRKDLEGLIRQRNDISTENYPPQQLHEKLTPLHPKNKIILFTNFLPDYVEISKILQQYPEQLDNFYPIVILTNGFSQINVKKVPNQYYVQAYDRELLKEKINIGIENIISSIEGKPKLKILVVESEKYHRNNMDRILTRGGYHTNTTTVKEWEQAYKILKPDITLIDPFKAFGKEQATDAEVKEHLIKEIRSELEGKPSQLAVGIPITQLQKYFASEFKTDNLLETLERSDTKTVIDILKEYRKISLSSLVNDEEIRKFLEGNAPHHLKEIKDELFYEEKNRLKKLLDKKIRESLRKTTAEELLNDISEGFIGDLKRNINAYKKFERFYEENKNQGKKVIPIFSAYTFIPLISFHYHPHYLRKDIVEHSLTPVLKRFEYQITHAQKPVLMNQKIPHFQIIVAGPSGSGKDSLCTSTADLIGAPNAVKGIEYIVAKTTLRYKSRPRRKDESKPSRFVELQEFKELVKSNFFKYHYTWNPEDEVNYGYGFANEDLDADLRKGLVFLPMIDPIAGLKIKKGDPDAVLIYMIDKLSDLQERNKRRKSEDREMRTRTLEAELPKFLGHWQEADYLIYSLYPSPSEDIMRATEILKSGQQLANIIQREIYLRQHNKRFNQIENQKDFVNGLYQQLLNVMSINGNSLEASFENLQELLFQEKKIQFEYDSIKKEIGEESLHKFLSERPTAQRINEAVLKSYFPMKIVGAIDTYGRRTILLENGDNQQKEVVRDLLTEYLGYYWQRGNVSEFKEISPVGLIKIDRGIFGGGIIKIASGAHVYLSHSLIPLEEPHTPIYAFNLAFIESNEIVKPERIPPKQLKKYNKPIGEIAINERNFLDVKK